MTSRARQLRNRATNDPSNVVDQVSELNSLLQSSDYDERRHATVAARKVAYAYPYAMIQCVSNLEHIACRGDSESIRREVCYALGYIGRVDDQAIDALTEPQRDQSAPEVRKAAAKARNSLATEPAPQPQTTGDQFQETEVFTDSESEDTKVFATDDTGDTAVYQPDQSPDRTTRSQSNFCSNCGQDLRNLSNPQFCPECGCTL